MKTKSILTVGLLSAVCTAYAAEEAAIEPFVWSRAMLDLISLGDVARGEEIARKSKCSKCHGDLGIAEDDESPSIAGQLASYNFKQMLDYKTEVRDSKDMKKATKNLSLQDMSDLAAYFATLPPEPPEGKAQPPLLVTRGDLDRLLLPCNVCHGEKGEGLGFEVPAIAGQKIEHFVETMAAFQEGDRQNDHYGRMRFIAGQLTEDELAELAAYYAAPPSPETDEEEEEEKEGG
jgi:cytochrome c553